MHTIIVQKELRHRPEKVWRALTDPNLVGQWLLENDLQPTVGRKFSFRREPLPNWNGIVECEVLESEPPRRLSYTWTVAGADPAQGLRTIVTWTLTPTPSGTRLRMEHSGFRPDQQANYQGAAYGWNKFLAGLEAVVATLP